MAVADCVCRMVPGVLPDEECFTEESHWNGLLEYPQYTKPREYRDMKVPEILLSGNHKEIDLWKFEQALRITRKRRPDLFESFCKNAGKLTEEQKKVMEKVLELL